jgi:hypothetical protein
MASRRRSSDLSKGGGPTATETVAPRSRAEGLGTRRGHPRRGDEFLGLFVRDITAPIVVFDAALVKWHAGHLTWAQAIREGRIELDGSPSLVKAFPTWNARSMFAHIRPGLPHRHERRRLTILDAARHRAPRTARERLFIGDQGRVSGLLRGSSGRRRCRVC